MPNHDYSILSHDSAWNNWHEGNLADKARKNGWEVTKRGWPDFLCFKDDEVIAVEVKPRLKDGTIGKLKKEQRLVMTVLSNHGIKCFVSDGEVLEPFNPNIH